MPTVEAYDSQTAQDISEWKYFTSDDLSGPIEYARQIVEAMTRPDPPRHTQMLQIESIEEKPPSKGFLRRSKAPIRVGVFTIDRFSDPKSVTCICDVPEGTSLEAGISSLPDWAEILTSDTTNLSFEVQLTVDTADIIELIFALLQSDTETRIEQWRTIVTDDQMMPGNY